MPDAIRDRQWYPLRCSGCARLLYKRTSMNPLKSGEMIQVKCSHCNEFTYLVGFTTEERDAARTAHSTT